MHLVYEERPSDDLQVTSQLRKIFRLTANLTANPPQMAGGSLVSEDQGFSITDRDGDTPMGQ